MRINGRLSGDGVCSSGKSLILDGKFYAGDRAGESVKLKLSKDHDTLEYEHTLMEVLYQKNSDYFIHSFGGSVLSAASGEILNQEGTNEGLDGYYCIAMEVGVVDLQEYFFDIKKDPSFFHEVKLIGAQLCELIEAAHAIGVVLMDFKPANVLRVQKKGRFVLKAIDFESSIELGNDGNPIGHYTLAGTPQYISPEVSKVLLQQMNGESAAPFKPTSAIDVFAFGLMVFECMNYKG